MTAVTEVESILNSRPLTIITSNDLEEPLTPSHLLVGRRLINIPDELCYRKMAVEYTEETCPVLLNRRLQHLHSVLDHFWIRWRDKYLLSLRERYCNDKRHSSYRKMKIGDIVIVQDDERAISFWKYGKVKEIIMGNDGEVRGGIVKLLSGGKQCTLLRRPVQKLIPLEVNFLLEEPIVSTDTNTNNEITEREEPSDEIDSVSSSTEPRPVRRSRRAAALEARYRIFARICED